jgi:cytochrome c-type biogenesis protein CcmF
MKPGDIVTVGGYEAKLVGLTQRQGPNYRERVARFSILSDGRIVGELSPSKRSFSARRSATTEAALLTRGVSQVYISLGEESQDGSIDARLYYKPLVLLIWLGAVLMAFGGILSLSDRRLRVGVPKPARGMRPMQPAE